MKKVKIEGMKNKELERELKNAIKLLDLCIDSVKIIDYESDYIELIKAKKSIERYIKYSDL